MAHMGATPDLDTVTRFLRQERELVDRVLAGTIDPAVVRRGLQHLLMGEPVTNLREGKYFVSLAKQIENVRRWNEENDWGFSEADFARCYLEASTFDWPGDPLQTIVLVPSFCDPATTFQNLARVCPTDGPGPFLEFVPLNLLRLIKDGDVTIGLRDGVEFRAHTLEWRLLDLDSHRQRTSSTSNACELVTPEVSAHAEVLAAIAHFPGWLNAFYKHEVPAVSVPGYSVHNREWSNHTGGLTVTGGSNTVSGYYVNVGIHMGYNVFPGYAVATSYPMSLGH